MAATRNRILLFVLSLVSSIVPLLVPGLVATAQAQSIPVAGYVLDAEGRPLARAQVELVPELTLYRRGLLELRGGPASEPVASTRSDPYGAFELRAPEAGMWRLEVRALGYVPMYFRLRPLMGARTLPPVSLFPDAGLRLRVVDPQGRPLKARVKAVPNRDEEIWRQGRSQGWRPSIRSSQTDEDGRATLNRVQGEDLWLRAWSPGFLESDELLAGGPTVRLVLEPGLSTEIEIRDPQARLKPGVLVRLGGWSWAVGLSGEDGRVPVTLPLEGEVGVELQLEGGQRERTSFQPSDEVKETGGAVRFLLPEPTFLQGQVVDREQRQAVGPGRPQSVGPGGPQSVGPGGPQSVGPGGPQSVGGAFVWQDAPGDFVLTDPQGRYLLPRGTSPTTVVQAAAWGFSDGRETVAPQAGDRIQVPPLALEPALSVAGSVVDEEGRPVAGVAVQVRPWWGGHQPWEDRAVQIRGLWTSAQGTFYLDGLRPRQTYEVRVATHGFAPTQQKFAPRDAEPLYLVLRRGARLLGRVVERSGLPVPAATAQLFAAQDKARKVVLVETTTDGEGNFEALHLAPGNYDVTLRRPGFATRTVPAVEIADPPLDVDLGELSLGPGGRVFGRVMDPDGEAILGAKIVRATEPYLMTQGPGFVQLDWMEADATSDERGHFVLEDLPRGEPVNLLVGHSAFLTLSVAGVDVPPPEPLEVVLQRGVRVFGTVRDTGGAPQAQASVHVSTEIRTANIQGSTSRTAETDENGDFVLDGVAPGRLTVEVHVDHFLRAKASERTVEAGDVVGPLDFVVERGMVVEGRVSDRYGRPAVAVAVSLSKPTGNHRSSYGTATDNDGNFRFEGVPPGPAELSATHPEHGRAKELLEVGPGGHRIDLVLNHGGRISGRVVDEEGKPVFRARVELRTRRAVAMAVTQADGTFYVYPENPGEYTLQVMAEGYAAWNSTQTFSFTADSLIDGIEARLVRGARITGTLSGLDPERLSTVKIHAFSQGTRSLPGVAAFDGTYRIEGVSPGHWRVTAHVPYTAHRAEGRVRVEAGLPEATLDLEFRGTLTLSGQIFHNGEPLPGAMVGLRGIDIAGSGDAATDPEGRFRLSGLESGSYRLSLVAGDLSHRERVELFQDQEISVDLRTSSVGGKVFDATTGNPVAGAHLTLESLSGNTRRGVTAQSDGDGNYVFSWVMEGTYWLAAQHESYAPLRTEVESRGLDIHGLDLLLDPGHSLLLEPRFSSGQIPDRIFVSVLGAGRQHILRADRPVAEDGRAEIRLPPGEWQLLVVVPMRHASAELAARVPGDAILPVVLRESTRLQVQVPALATEPRPATLTVSAAQGSSSAAGSYRQVGIQGGRAMVMVPEGTWQVEVRTEDGDTWQATAVTRPGEMAVVVLE